MPPDEPLLSLLVELLPLLPLLLLEPLLPLLSLPLLLVLLVPDEDEEPVVREQQRQHATAHIHVKAFTGGLGSSRGSCLRTTKQQPPNTLLSLFSPPSTPTPTHLMRCLKKTCQSLTKSYY